MKFIIFQMRKIQLVNDFIKFAGYNFKAFFTIIY